MKRFLHGKLLLVLLLACSIHAVAQKGDTLKILRNSQGKITFASFKADSTTNRPMKNYEQFLRSALRMKAYDKLRLIRSRTDKRGITHKRFQQFYKGIKVENATYLIHGKNGKIQYMNGHFATINIASVTPAISEKTALSHALDFVNAKKYNWEDPGMEAFIKKKTGNPDTTCYPKGELVIVKNFLKGGKSWRLTWKFTISALEPPSSQFVYVDAITGEVINTEPLLLDANAPGTADTRYSGTENITGDSFTGGFRLRENRNGVNIQTLDMQHGTNIANAVDFVDNDNDWTAAEYHNANEDDAALDAHWGAEAVLDYWNNMGRNSIDDNGLPVISYVHFDSFWGNARWDMGNHVMLYGDGFNNPFTALDICAHEFGHGICQFTSDLEYQGESGALNEGFSDIWGAAIEAWKAPAKQQWLLGEDLGTPSRSMSNPNLYGQPDTYGDDADHWYSQSGCSPSPYNDYCGVHTNSGVLNFWFYLLTEGGNDINDNGDAYNVSGIGISEASDIAYHTEQDLSSLANYSNARDVSIQVASNLYGTNSCEVISVTNAWYAVGVGGPFDYNEAFSINGPDVVCTNATYNLSGLPSGATVVWSASPSGAVNLTSSGSQVGVAKISNAYVTLNANITMPCESYTMSKQITVGTPAPALIAIPSSLPGEPTTIDVYASRSYGSIEPIPGATYNWYRDGVLQSAHGDEFIWYIPCNHESTLSCEAITSCGTSPQTSLNEVGGCRQRNIYTISPNPAQYTISITFNNENNNIESRKFGAEPSNTIQGIKQASIYDASGKLVKQQLFSENPTQVQMDISNLSPGIYIIKISDGIHAEQQKLVIQ